MSTSRNTSIYLRELVAHWRYTRYAAYDDLCVLEEIVRDPATPHDCARRLASVVQYWRREREINLDDIVELAQIAAAFEASGA